MTRVPISRFPFLLALALAAGCSSEAAAPMAESAAPPKPAGAPLSEGVVQGLVEGTQGLWIDVQVTRRTFDRAGRQTSMAVEPSERVLARWEAGALRARRAPRADAMLVTGGIGSAPGQMPFVTQAGLEFIVAKDQPDIGFTDTNVDSAGNQLYIKQVVAGSNTTTEYRKNGLLVANDASFLRYTQGLYMYTWQQLKLREASGAVLVEETVTFSPSGAILLREAPAALVVPSAATDSCDPRDPGVAFAQSGQCYWQFINMWAYVVGALGTCLATKLAPSCYFMASEAISKIYAFKKECIRRT